MFSYRCKQFIRTTHKASIRYWFLLCLVACFFISGPAAFAQSPQCGPYAKFYSKDSVTVITFGASTIKGFPVPYSFQPTLTKFIENCYTNKVVTVENYGVVGETTSEGLLRFDKAITGKSGFLLLLMGANDAVQIVDGRLKVSTTINNMRQMVMRAQEKNLDVILGTIQYFREIPGNSADARTLKKRNIVVDQINNGYKSLAAYLHVRIADINSVIGKNKALYVDEVHLNSKGYRALALTWFDAINHEILDNYLEPGITQNFPNPANGTTKIGLSLPSTSRVVIKIFNLKGKLIETSLDDFRNSGYYEEEFNTSKLEPGMYILQIQILGKNYIKKMLIAR